MPTAPFRLGRPEEGILNYREIGDKFGVGVSTACKKVNTAGTDEGLFRLVPVPGHGARALPTAGFSKKKKTI